jgi:acetate---CoA ligase (ADP-forming)
LAGNYQAHEAVFRQFGFVIADDLSELLYYSKIFVSEISPKGGRVGIITDGGGAGVLCVDAIGTTTNLQLAELSKKTQKALRKVMPPLVNIRNPLDLAGDAEEVRYGNAMSMMGSDDNVDMILAIVLFQTPGADSRVAAKMVNFKDRLNKPVIVLSIGAA